MDNSKGTMGLSFYATELELIEKKEKQLAALIVNELTLLGQNMALLAPAIEKQGQQHQRCLVQAAQGVDRMGDLLINWFEQTGRIKAMFADLLLDSNSTLLEKHQPPNQQK